MQNKKTGEKKESHWVNAGDFVAGQVQPAELRRLSQKVAEDVVEASEVSDAVVTETQRAAQVLLLRVCA